MFELFMLFTVAMIGSGLGCFLYDEFVCTRNAKTKNINVQLFEGLEHSFVDVFNQKSKEIIKIIFDKNGTYSIKYETSRKG